MKTLNCLSQEHNSKVIDLTYKKKGAHLYIYLLCQDLTIKSFAVDDPICMLKSVLYVP